MQWFHLAFGSPKYFLASYSPKFNKQDVSSTEVRDTWPGNGVPPKSSHLGSPEGVECLNLALLRSSATSSWVSEPKSCVPNRLTMAGSLPLTHPTRRARPRNMATSEKADHTPRATCLAAVRAPCDVFVGSHCLQNGVGSLSTPTPKGAIF